MMGNQGMGIAPAAEFAAAQFLAEGQLVRVLPDYSFPSSFTYVLCASERYRSSRVEQIIEFLKLGMSSTIHRKKK